MAKHDLTLDLLFRALSDPTRRAMISRLMEGPLSVGDLAEPFDMRLPTVMAHLGKLEEAGLVRSTKTGRTRICEADPKALATAQDWISAQSTAWNARLDRLEAYLDQTAPKEGPPE